jgi:hypothetical protein
MSSRLFGFPNPVNERSARWVATGVVVQAVLFLIVRQGWVLIPLAYGFTARVLTGPKLSPLGQLSTRVLTPAMKGEGRLVPGPPKRFAQGIGLVFSVGATIAWFAGVHTVAASLEAFVGFCLGCVIFGKLMRLGVIPESVCEDCNDISRRLTRPSV